MLRLKKTIVMIGISFYSAFFVKVGFAVSSGAFMVLSIIKGGKRKKIKKKQLISKFYFS